LLLWSSPMLCPPGRSSLRPTFTQAFTITGERLMLASVRDQRL
jgi:hypothetical protein